MLRIITHFIVIVIFTKYVSKFEKRYRIKTNVNSIIFELLSLKIYRIITYSIYLFTSIESNIKIYKTYSNNIMLYMVIGAILFGLGISLRVFAIRRLGEFWSYHVELKENHRIIKDGIYKYIKHPGYLGNIYLCGLTIFYGAFLTLGFTIIFIVIFGLYRIYLENIFILHPLEKNIRVQKKAYQYKVGLTQ